MINLASIVMVLGAVGFIESLRGIKRHSDDLALFTCLTTMFMSTGLFGLSAVWWLGGIGNVPPPPAVLSFNDFAHWLGQ